MPLQKLQFRPGINRDITSYSNEGGWFDCDKVRFYQGYPQKIGGWEKYSTNTYLGTARALKNWVALDGSNYLGVGTNIKYYIEEGGAFSDITPIRETTAAGDVTFSATNGSSIITVTDIAHGAGVGDFVTFSGSTSLGGAISAAILDKEYEILTVVDSDTYEIDVVFTANASDTGNGGSSTVGAYQLNVGTNNAVSGTGWGAGYYGGLTAGALQTAVNEGGTFLAADTTLTVTSTSGFPATGTLLIGGELMDYSGIAGNDFTGLTRGVSGTTAADHANGSTVFDASTFVGWGSAAAATTFAAQLRLWSHDNFGEDLLINPRDGGIYYWDKTQTLSNRAVELSAATTGAAIGTKQSVPQIAKQVMISDEDRHTIAFGCDGLGANSAATQGDGVQDSLLIRFSDQEDPVVWWPATDNTAGELRLGIGSTFVRAIETKREILVWTDKGLHSMRFIGPPFTFGITLLASNITIAGPNAVASTEDFVFWMGIDNFYVYAGQTTILPCTVRDYVFNDFNTAQAAKVFAGVNSQWGEVFWFYPSSASSDNDRYVVYNYIEKAWYYGNLARTAWIDRGVRTFPIGAGNNYLFNHEAGQDDDGSAMTAYIESSQLDIGDGHHYTLINGMLPDIKFDGSDAIGPQATFELKARTAPGSNYNQSDSGSSPRTATSPVEQFTQRLNLRVRGRSFALKVSSNTSGVQWTLGSPRVDMRQDGRR